MTTNPSQKRQPKGTETGGQFAESKNPEAAVDLMFKDDVSTEFRSWLSGRITGTRQLLNDHPRSYLSDLAGVKALDSQLQVLEWVGSNFDRIQSSPSPAASAPEFDGYSYADAVNMADDEYPVTPEIWAEAVRRLNANGAADRINNRRYEIVEDAVLEVANESSSRDAESTGLSCPRCSAPLSKSDYTGTAIERSGVKNHYKCPSCAAVSKMDADQ
jgi:hypothetical protein